MAEPSRVRPRPTPSASLSSPEQKQQVFASPSRKKPRLGTTAKELCTALFDAADLDRDGVLVLKDAQRVSAALRELGDATLCIEWEILSKNAKHERLVSKTEFVQHLVQKWAGKIDPATGKFREEFARIMAQAISLARSVTAKQLMSLVFDALDANGDGRLSKDEFLRAAVALGEKVLSDWKEIHNEFGSDPDSLVTRAQCIRHWTKKLAGCGALVGQRFERKYETFVVDSLSRLKEIEAVRLAERLFDALDRNHDGFVEKREVLRAADALGDAGDNAEKRWTEMLHTLGKNDPEDYRIRVTKPEYVKYWMVHFHEEMKIRGEEARKAYIAYILNALEHLKTLKARELCEAFFKAVDTNNDGKIGQWDAMMCHSVFNTDPVEGLRIWKGMVPHGVDPVGALVSLNEYVGYWMRELESEIGTNDHFHPHFARSLQVRLAQLNAKIAGVQRGPIRHLVLFDLPTDSEKEISKEFRHLRGKISNIVEFQDGSIQQPMMKAQQGKLTNAFLVTFKNKDSRDAYLPHPEHKKFVEKVKPFLTQSLTVFDYVPSTLASIVSVGNGGGGEEKSDGAKGPEKGCESSTSKETTAKGGGGSSMSVLLVRLRSKVDPISFAKGCKDAAHETKVPVCIEWGGMINSTGEINLAQKASHIVLMRFENESAAEVFSKHQAWASWMRRMCRGDESSSSAESSSSSSGSKESSSGSKADGGGGQKALVQQVVAFFTISQVS